MTAEKKAIEIYEEMFYKVSRLNRTAKESDAAAIDCAIILANTHIEIDPVLFFSPAKYGEYISFWRMVKRKLKMLY